MRWLAVFIVAYCGLPVMADDATRLEAWLGKSGKLVRAQDGTIEKAVLYGEKSTAAQRDPSVVGKRFTDDDLARLAQLDTLTTLRLDGFTDITGTGFAKLAGLKKLVALETENSAFTEDGLAALGKVTSIQRVYLGHTKTNLAGATKMVAGLPNLEEYRPGVYATDAMLAAVGDRPGLRKLIFGAHWAPIGDDTLTRKSYEHLLKLTALTDLTIEVFPEDVHPQATVEIIRKLKTLENLTLICAVRSKGRCIVARDDLAGLASLPELTTFRLVGDNAIGYTLEPGALQVLQGCPKLRSLFIHQTQAADAEFLALKQVMPKLKIQYIRNRLKPVIQTW
jgi:hypothetical protein